MNTNQDQTRIVEIGEADFEAEVLASRGVVMVVFSAPWSRPCHVLDSVLDEVAAAGEAGLKVVRINADDNPDLSLLYEIQSIPTLLFFRDGNLSAKVVGTASKEAILAKLHAVCQKPSDEPSASTRIEDKRT